MKGGKEGAGPTGNSGAFGALRVPALGGGAAQLLQVASLHVLEHALQAAGFDPDHLRNPDDDWSADAEWVTPWIKRTAEILAIAAISSAAVVEVEALLIDGAMPEPVRANLVEVTRACVARHTVTGIRKPVIEAAAVGRTARSIGAAMLPIHSKYFLA